MEKAWLIWIIFGVIFLIGEMFTAGFFLMWFGIAAILAGLVDLIGLGPAWQWGVFVIASAIMVFLSRKFSEKITEAEPEPVGANRMVGKTGIVVKDIPAGGAGMVKIEGEEWLGTSGDESAIPAGTKNPCAQS